MMKLAWSIKIAKIEKYDLTANFFDKK